MSWGNPVFEEKDGFFFKVYESIILTFYLFKSGKGIPRKSQATITHLPKVFLELLSKGKSNGNDILAYLITRVQKL